MTLTLSDLQHMDSSKVVLASNEAQRRDAWIVSMEAFGMESSDEPTTFSMDSTAIAYDGAQPAASGWMVGGGPIAELCGVGTRQEFRRRGYASAVSHRLLDAFFEGGGELAWLSAGDDAAEEVYSRLGFKRALTQVNLRWTD